MHEPAGNQVISNFIQLIMMISFGLFSMFISRFLVYPLSNPMADQCVLNHIFLVICTASLLSFLRSYSCTVSFCLSYEFCSTLPALSLYTFIFFCLYMETFDSLQDSIGILSRFYHFCFEQ